MKGSRYLAGVVLGISCGVSLAAAEERPASWRFDFGPGDVAPGFTRVVASSIYSDEQGYGFDLGSRAECFDRGGRDPLERDLCASSGSLFFSVKAPEGNYRVTATFGDGKAASLTTVKAESRRLMIERLATPAGGFETRTFVVNVRNSSLGPKGDVKLKPREIGALHWDDKLTIEFGDDRPAIAALEITLIDDVPTLFLAGDSTVTDQTTEPWAAWGQMLPRFFGPGVAIANHAESGETLKAFVTENRLAKVLSLLKAGDYLFIQFNHNDQKPGPNHLDAFTTYKDQVKLFIGAARERGATPVLVTSMLRRNFDAAGRIVNTLGDYPEALRQVAKEEGVALTDLFNASKALYEALGPEVSKHAFVHYPAGSFPGQDQELKDDTHFSPYGAYQLARAVVEGIKAEVPALAKHLATGIPAFDPSRPDSISSWKLPATPVHITPTPAPQVPAAQRVSPNLETNIDRPLRYRPDDVDFVIEDGEEFFNRPLYGGNTAFRVDGGDKPEFVLYLPGRGGNLRFALRSTAGALWLHNSARITTRYRPGELHYEIRDRLLGPSGGLRPPVVRLPREGMIVRTEATGIPPGIELMWAYGGLSGERGRRDGDIGTEDVPIGEWFQLKPAFAEGNRFELKSSGFTLHAAGGVIEGAVPDGARQQRVDASLWNDLPALLASDPSGAPGRPVILGAVPITNGKPVFLSLERLTSGSWATLSVFDLPRVLTEAQAHFVALRKRVSVDTPDPFLNAAMGALNVAADAAWDEPQQALMHGAIAWRRKLLGWRGAYALDALGWPDRAKAHYRDWASRQNVSPIPETLPPPDEDANLARSEAALHSHGDLSNSHYDMNAVYIDAFFRHLLWTGDTALAKAMWPVIERHLAWERRLFRREFGPDKLPLYEAYAMIWASDDLQYSGGGTAQASAYNYWHNTMAARAAALIGVDGEPYNREAALIARAMRTHLWMSDRGMFAETKDWLGLQRLHPSSALWSFYLPIDSEVATPQEAWDMARYVDSEIPRLPVRGPGVPVSLHTLATSNWMPYTWSINNVVMSEAVHAALAYWRAGRPEEAWRITRGSMLAAMFMGISPGNVGSMSYLDAYRRESQRDFADGSGVLSRALIEGLFGIRPDALAGELTIAPGLPQEWDHATLNHPSVRFACSRKGRSEVFTVQARFERAMTLRLLTPVAGETAAVLIDGRVAKSRLIPGPFPRLAVVVPPTSKTEIRITWSGKTPAPRSNEPGARTTVTAPGGPLPDLPVDAKLETINLEPHFNDRVTEIFRPGKYRSPRSPFVSLALPSQGIGYWAGHVNATADIDDRGLRGAAAIDGAIRLPGGIAFATPGPGDSKNIIFTSQWDNYPREVTVPLSGQARLVYLLMAGSTNSMQSRLENGEVVVTYTDGTTSRLVLRNPETWWPIEQDYFIDDYQFRLEGPLPLRVDLKTGRARKVDRETFKGQGGVVPGGAATVLHLPLDPDRQLRSLTVRALANDVVIGLLAASLVR